MTKGT